jgi:hypothetical protein
MNGSQSSGETKVTVTGRGEPVHDQAALASLCAAVERAVQAYRAAGFKVREVVVTLEAGTALPGTVDSAPAFVDVYDSGYGHGI